MESISAASSSNSLLQAVLAQADAQTRIDTAVLATAQEVQIQQGSAIVQLIESALIDVRV
ncbi:MAG TPA: hypothetical protein V6D23_14635 [Candidatus Obscuribacterales bacterium]